MTNLGIHVIDVSCEKANFIPTLIPILGQPIAMQSIQWPWCKCMWWNWRNFSFSQNANDVNTFNTSVNLKIFRSIVRKGTLRQKKEGFWYDIWTFHSINVNWNEDAASLHNRLVWAKMRLSENCVRVCVRDFPWLFERDKISCILNMSNTFKIQTPQQSTLFLFQVIKCDFVVTNSNIVARSFWVFQ